MILRKLTILFTLIILTACGSSERVITDEGKVYEVKGNTIKNNGVNVTDSLSADEKEAINTVKERKEEAKKAFEKQQKELEDAIEKQDDIQKVARKKQNELEEKLKILENNLENKQDVRDNYATIKKRYIDKKNKFKKLKKEGKLSPNDIKDWKEKLSALKERVKQANIEMNKKV